MLYNGKIIFDKEDKVYRKGPGVNELPTSYMMPDTMKGKNNSKKLKVKEDLTVDDMLHVLEAPGRVMRFFNWMGEMGVIDDAVASTAVDLTLDAYPK